MFYLLGYLISLDNFLLISPKWHDIESKIKGPQMPEMKDLLQDFNIITLSVFSYSLHFCWE